MVGFYEGMYFLMAQLLSDEKHRCICSIVGTKGTAKTELAKFISTNKAVLSHFDCVISTAELLKNEIAKAAKIIMGGQHKSYSEPWLHLIVVDDLQTQLPMSGIP